MSERERIEKLRARLLPRDTRLQDVPPDWRGLSWKEYEEVMLYDLANVPLPVKPVAPGDPVPAPAAPKISTKRDSYGWKSLPSGSSYYGEEAKPKKGRGRS